MIPKNHIALLKTLNAFASRITQIHELNELAEAADTILKKVIQVEYTGLYLYNFQTNQFNLLVAKGLSEEERLEAERTANKRHPGYVFRKKKMLYIPDTDKDITRQSITSNRSFKVLSRLYIPVMNGNISVGAFGVASSEKNRFNDETIEVLTFICNIAGAIYGNILHQKELEKAKQEADASNIAKSHFLANMSHEMRTPLNAINGLIKMLDQTPLSSKQEKLMTGIRSSNEGLLEIITDILDFSKIEAGQLKLEESTFLIEEQVLKTINALEFKATESNNELTYEIDEAVKVPLWGDGTKLRQVLLNLLNNAVKFTESGKITLTCKRISSDATSSSILFRVKDTGIGIAKENFPKLFRSFQQEDSSTTRKYGGTGLGLAISKQLVEMMGGTLQVKSVKGQGSEFYFTIRFNLAKEETTPFSVEETAIHTGSIKGARVLLVEDNEFNKLVANSILEQYQAKVTMAGNGKEAIDILENHPYDIVLMDLQMPVMGGIEATKKIRNGMNLKIPVLALTANVIAGVPEKCFAAGMNDYISKPFEPETLIKKISNNLGMIH